MTTRDALGRVVRVDTPDGFSVTEYAAGSLPGSRPPGLSPGPYDVAYQKNAKGDLERRFRSGDRVVLVQACDPTSASDDTPLPACASPEETYYTYEASGELSTIYDARAAATSVFYDPNRYLRYHYDTLGRVIRIDDPDLSGDTPYTLTGYDAVGNVLSVTNARGQERTFRYDLLDRLTHVEAPPGEDDYDIVYLGSRQPWLESSSHYARTYAYDDLGRVEQETLYIAGDSGSTVFHTGFQYDLLGRRNQVTHPDDPATAIRYEYEGAYLERVCDLQGASDCGDPAAVAYVADVDYDALGRRRVTRGAAGSRVFDYDYATYRLERDRFDGANADGYWVEQRYDAYDEVGNLEQVTRTSSAGDLDVTEIYQYDGRNRLSHWNTSGTPLPTADLPYGYDELGNLTVHAGAAQVYDDPERPHAIQSRAGGQAAYAYDDDGNVASVTGAGATDRHLAFDSANRLVCVGPTAASCSLSETSSVPGRTLFRYDVHGERLVEFDEGTASGHWDAYVGDGFVYSARAAGPEGTVEIQAFGERIGLVKIPNVALRTTQTFGLGIVPPPPEVLTGLGALALLGLLAWGVRRGALVLVVRRPAFAGTAVFLAVTLVIPPVSWGSGGGGVERYWELTDPLGTGMVLVDATGARVRHTLYTPFGAEYTTAGGSSLRRYYAGHRRQEATGLYYMRARWYDADSGTFLSVDPLVVPSDPQSHTAYSYARNNPISMNDPEGLSSLGIQPPEGVPIMVIHGCQGCVSAGQVAISIPVPSDPFSLAVGVPLFALAYVFIGSSLLNASSSPGQSHVSQASSHESDSEGIENGEGAQSQSGEKAGGKENTADQDAAIQMAKEAKRKGGLTRDEAHALVEQAREAGVKPVHDHTSPDEAAHHRGGPHIRIGPVNHIPVRP